MRYTYITAVQRVSEFRPPIIIPGCPCPIGQVNKTSPPRAGGRAGLIFDHRRPPTDQGAEIKLLAVVVLYQLAASPGTGVARQKKI